MESVINQNLSRRLIVLISDSMVHNQDLAHEIHWLAFRENLPVLFLVVVADNNNRMATIRDMATMRAVTASNRLLVEVNITETSDWLETLRKTAAPGDAILCPEEQTVVNGLFKTVPISDFLSSQLNVQIRTISGFYDPTLRNTKKWFQEFFAFFGFLAILAVFTWLQIELELALDGSSIVAKILVMFTFCIEMGAVWGWNKFAYR